MIPEEKILTLKNEYEELKKDIYDPAKMSDQRYYSKISKRFKELQEILDIYEILKDHETTIAENKELIKSTDDKELISLAEEETIEAQEYLEKKITLLRELLVPKDPNDEKDAII